MKVPFVRECCYCGTTLGVDWLDYDTLSPENVRRYETYHKIVSHGICDPCYKKEMTDAKAEAEETVDLSIEELEAYLNEGDSHE